MVKINVLFVCLGNICRSPMADGVFQHMVKQAGLDDKISVDSAGTAGYHVGEHADRRTLAVLQKHDIPYDGRARRFVSRDGDNYDYILAMDYSNFENIRSILRSSDAENVHMFLQFAKDAGTVDVIEVPDPYYNNKFDYVYELVTKGSKALLDHIRKEHNL